MRIQRQIALILAAAIAAPALAGDSSLWSNLGTLKPGQRIGIIQSDSKRMEGRFETFTDLSISLRGDHEIILPKEHVIRVYRRPRTRRTIRTVIGAAIGAVAGAILTGTVGARFRNEGLDLPAGPFIGGGAGIGAGIGALTGGGYQTVYQRSARLP
jgi:hypothetical protein